MVCCGLVRYLVNWVDDRLVLMNDVMCFGVIVGGYVSGKVCVVMVVNLLVLVMLVVVILRCRLKVLLCEVLVGFFV